MFGIPHVELEFFEAMQDFKVLGHVRRKDAGNAQLAEGLVLVHGERVHNVASWPGQDLKEQAAVVIFQHRLVVVYDRQRRAGVDLEGVVESRMAQVVADCREQHGQLLVPSQERRVLLEAREQHAVRHVRHAKAVVKVVEWIIAIWPGQGTGERVRQQPCRIAPRTYRPAKLRTVRTHFLQESDKRIGVNRHLVKEAQTDEHFLEQVHELLRGGGGRATSTSVSAHKRVRRATCISIRTSCENSHTLRSTDRKFARTRSSMKARGSVLDVGAAADASLAGTGTGAGPGVGVAALAFVGTATAGAGALLAEAAAGAAAGAADADGGRGLALDGRAEDMRVLEC